MLKRANRRLAELRGTARPATPPPRPAAPRREEAPQNQALLPLIIRQDMKPDPPRDSHEGYAHVSTLIHHCPRKLFLMSAHEIEEIRDVRGRDRIMWKIGRAVESHVRDSLIAQLGRENVLGDWACLCGGTVRPVYYSHQSTMRCPHCCGALEYYREHTLLDRENKVSGSPDFLRLLPSGAVQVVEFKSKAIHHFRDLGAPEPNHILQTGCYHRLASGDFARQNELTIARTARIIYVAKDYPAPGVQPYKEFEVDMTAGPLVREVDRLFGTARALWQARQSTRGRRPAMPARLPSCASPSSVTAKGCCACVSCFSMD